jgi:hypothetical protein
MAWKRRKSDSDLFLAGVWKGKAVIVGRSTCYALDINNGNLLWEVTTSSISAPAMPSGQGVASNDIYYLPLDNGEICAINVETGKITRNRPGTSDAPVPGNLVFHEGVVVSQTYDEIIVYPQLTSKLEVVEAEFKKQPDNLSKMLELSELKLASGQVHEAVKLMYALKSKNPPEDIKNRLQQKLYEGLTDLFQVDFKKARTDYLTDYEQLLALGSADEQQKRKATFYRLLGSGLEEDGDLVGAFVAYRKFGSLPVFQKDGIPAKDDPLRKVPAQVWFRGRLSAMFEKAKGKGFQMKPLEDKIREEWQAVSNDRNVDAIRSFVAMFDPNFEVGQQARLQLANTIIDRGAANEYLEAELSLEQLRSEVIVDPKTGKSLAESVDPGAKALEALARLEMKKRSMKLAAEYYRELAERFPNAVVRDGKTGKQFLDELSTNKTLLQHLEPTSAQWGASRFKFRELSPGSINTNLAGLMLFPAGNLNPETAQLRLILEPLTTSPKLRLVDLATNKDVWQEYLSNQETNSWAFKIFSQQIAGNPNLYADAQFRTAHVMGHLAVVQVGTMAYAIDLSKPGIQWKHSLMSQAVPMNFYQPQSTATVDAHGHLELNFKLLTPVQRIIKVRVGYVAAVQPSYVALVQQDRLVVIDPLSDKSPKVLWTRGNLTDDTHVFGDDQYIYLVDVVKGTAVNSRALRASDGTPVQVPNFAGIYNRRLHVSGSRILSSHEVNNQLVVRLYDLPTGKDLWKGTYPAGSQVLKTVDPNLTGVIEPDGKMSVVDLRTLQVACQANVLQGRVGKNVLATMERPLLLADREHYYVALNQPINNNIVNGGQLATNFGNGLRSEAVNGWFGAFHRRDGSKKVGDQVKTWKKGDLHWYSSEPVTHQLVVTEHFEHLPLVLFSVRYNEKKPAGGGFGTSQWISKTQSIDKATGKWVHYPFTPRLVNGFSPSYHILTVDAKAGQINMIGFSSILQHYVDDGRPPQAGFDPKPPVNAPVAVVPQLPQEFLAKLDVIAAKLNDLPAGRELNMSVPGQAQQIIIRTGNPVMIVFPGNSPIPLQEYLNQAKKQ